MNARWMMLVLLCLVGVLASVAARTPRPHSHGSVLADHELSRAAVPRLSPHDDVPEDIAALRERIAEVLHREGVPGVGIALVDRSGVRWAGGVGVADVEAGVPVHADTAFRVASISKSIVGLGVARLHAQGRLDLAAPIGDTLPDLVIDNPWQAVAPVTIGHVLEHTAGFDDMRFNEWFSPEDRTSPEAALAINPRSRVVRWRPGSRMSYSNVGYTIAALAIERATGEPFDQWLHHDVLMPLGMGRAAFHRTADLAARMATGYRAPDLPVPFRDIAHRGAGALLASPSDLGRLVHFWIRRGDGVASIVPAPMLDRIERSATSNIAPTDGQYGLGNYGDLGHPVIARGHDGGLPGFLSCYRYFPSLGVGYVMLLNSSHSLRAYLEIRALLFAWLVRGRVLPDPPAPPRDAEPPTGFFSYANPRHELFGFLERALLGWRAEPQPNGRLRLSPLLGGSIDLVATPDGGWRHPLESGTSVRFGADASGRPAMVAGFAYAERSSHAVARVRLWLLAAASFALQLAPLYALVVLVLSALLRRSLRGTALVVWPALASLSFTTTTLLLRAALARDELGDVTLSTVGLCVATVLFAFFSARAFVASLAAALAREGGKWAYRLVPTVTATLAFGLTLWLGAHGIIGLRTWAW